jgi:hypothetical protein
MRPILPLFAVTLFASVPALAIEPVGVPAFHSVELRGGGEVLVRPGPTQRVTIVEGSSRFTRFRVERGGQLRIDSCTGDCPRPYRLRIEIQSPRAPDLAVSGGGEIHVVPGFAPQSRLAAAVNGGGGIDARSLDAAEVTAAVHGGGDLQVHARSTLTAAVNGGGTIRYSGNPQVTSAIAGGGTVLRTN